MKQSGIEKQQRDKVSTRISNMAKQ